MLPSAWRSGLQVTLLRAWTRKGLLPCALLPISISLHGVRLLRRLCYQIGIFKVGKVDATVIVVGNVVAGGAGKTPTVIALVNHLKSQGKNVGVVSRGYGRGDSGTREVTTLSTAHEVGDEPAMLFRVLGVPLFVGASRLLAAQALLLKHPHVDTIVCDDGMQHYALFRDLEVCVFDTRGCGNGWLLPSGPLRESWPPYALRRAGQSDQRRLVLHTGSPPAFEGHAAQRMLSDHAVRQNGDLVAISTLCAPGNLPLLALAGIAKPEAFFALLRAKGLQLAKTISLPDHYDFHSYSNNTHGGYTVICTEKDAAKLWQTHPGALAAPLIQSMPFAFWAQFDALLQQAQHSRLSSKNGYSTS
jgi:tetraacyldisaccharide 4'-kinase